MPINLVGMLLGLLVSVAGDAGIRLALPSPKERALRKVLGLANRQRGRAGRFYLAASTARGAERVEEMALRPGERDQWLHLSRHSCIGMTCATGLDQRR